MMLFGIFPGVLAAAEGPGWGCTVGTYYTGYYVVRVMVRAIRVLIRVTTVYRGVGVRVLVVEVLEEVLRLAAAAAAASCAAGAEW